MTLYNTRLYNAWVEVNPERGVPLPSHGDQIAAIRTQGPDTNHIVQTLTVPANRYCMLHFFHGYNNSWSPRCPDRSNLLVQTRDRYGTVLTQARYHSTETIGEDGSLKEV